ncbi:B12-binding domain-containing radical SAM protein [Betaproteobacteria bacterium]|nr:B12-binding domain-containing radical SAM protein [Betaproteobacteria bacterium]
MSIDILFVHPNASKIIYQELANKNSAIEPPIWAGMLANSVLQSGFRTEVLDAEVEQLDFLSCAKTIIQYKARIICFVVYGQQPSASSQNMEGAVATAIELRKLDPSVFVLFVGGHVAALPVETLENESCIDAVCQNEGVYTIRELVSLPKLSEEYLKGVDGLTYRDSTNNIIVNSPSKLVPKADLEKDLPGIAWGLLPPLKKYRTAGWHSWSNNTEKQPFAALYTSLGCPYKCSFCMINIINRTDNSPSVTSDKSNIFRWWQPDFIIKTFDYLANQGVINIKIADELFVLNPNHFLRICELIVERGYQFNIWAYSRVDTCKPKYLEMLKKAGVNWLGLGIENPDNENRRVIHKEGFKEVSVLEQIRVIRSEGINVGGNYIFGLPFDDNESMQRTLNFAIENPTEMANFYCAMAYPGSPLFAEARKLGYQLPKSYAGFSQHSYETLNLRNKNLTAAEILTFRDKAWKAYHESPNYLGLMEEKFGKKAVEELNDTKKIALKRRILEQDAQAVR